MPVKTFYERPMPVSHVVLLGERNWFVTAQTTESGLIHVGSGCSGIDHKNTTGPVVSTDDVISFANALIEFAKQVKDDSRK